MKLPFKIALRFLTSNKGQTILIALGIAVGVSVQIFIGSLIQGLQKSLVDKTIGNSSQITITSNIEDKKIKDYNEIMNNIKTADDRIINISASADGPGLIKKDNKTYSILLRGFNLEDSNKIYNIKNRIYEGSEPTKDYEVLLGKDLKEELKLRLNDSIDIIANTGSIETVKVTGFYDLNVVALNKSWMITNISTAQKIFKYESSVTSLEMQVKEVFKADEIAASLSAKFSSEYKDIKVENWKAQNAQLLSGLNGQSVSSIMIQVFVLIAVVLGIASVLAITVLQKSKQIGILKAMGIKDSTASLIFLFQGLLLGILGAILGVLLGLGLSFSFTKFALNPDGTPVVALYIDYGFIALSALIALASSTLAALIPARRSSKLNPIEVIRNG
jgi:lipoprotein-releasing system permease protein